MNMGTVRCSHSGELDEKVYGNFLVSLKIKKKVSFKENKQAILLLRVVL